MKKDRRSVNEIVAETNAKMRGKIVKVTNGADLRVEDKPDAIKWSYTCWKCGKCGKGSMDAGGRPICCHCGAKAKI